MQAPLLPRSARRRRRWLQIVALYLTVCVAPMAVAGKKYEGGVWPFLASCCIGPRVGLEMNEGVGVRDVEQFSWLPVVGWFGYRFYMAWEAYDGKTFSEIAKQEGLLATDPGTPPLPAEAAPSSAAVSPSEAASPSP